jgi:glycosidase
LAVASSTPQNYRSLVLYEIYTRNHGPNGTFADVEADLERIRSMGVDIVWFMPIHPIGAVQRKGTLGSPYSIADYRAVNPEFGSIDDFTRLIDRAHALGLKVMIDVVFNHTAHDSNLVNDHPDWYHQDESGAAVTTVPDWSDVIDLKYPNQALEDYLIESLLGWVRVGVDGFRCDVASLIPVEFWLRARSRISEINPKVIWLAESVHLNFIADRRDNFLRAHSDSEVFTAFDMCYDYDIWPIWQAVVTGQLPVSRYLEMLRAQDGLYPTNYVKMRCVENHDQARILNLAGSRDQARAWTAFMAFNKGAFLIYAGQEAPMVHTPSLFEIDKVTWGNYEEQPLLMTLAKLKKDPAVTNGLFTIFTAEPVIAAAWEAPEGCLLGIFNVERVSGLVDIPLPDGEYEDLLSGASFPIHSGQAAVPNVAVILRYKNPVHPSWFYSTLMNLNIPPDSHG